MIDHRFPRLPQLPLRRAFRHSRYRLAVKLALIAVLLGPTMALAARVLLTDGQLKAEVADGSDWCQAETTVVLRSADTSAFRDEARLARLVGGLRAALSFECPQATSLHMRAALADGSTFDAVATQADGWQLSYRSGSVRPGAVEAPPPPPPPAAPVQTPAAEVRMPAHPGADRENPRALAPERAAAPRPSAAAVKQQPPAPRQASAVRQPRAAADAGAAVPALEMPIAPPVQEPTGGSHGGVWLVLVVLLFGGAAAWFFWRRRTAVPVVVPRPLKKPPAAAPLRRDTTPPLAPPPERPEEASSAAAASDAPPPASVAESTAEMSVKQRFLLEQELKYQAGVTAAMDALTRTQAALGQSSAVPEWVRGELRRVSGSALKSVRTRLRKRAFRPLRMLGRALLLIPLWKWLRSFRPILQIVLAGLLLWLLASARSIALQWVMATGKPVAVSSVLLFIYALVLVPLGFWVGRRHDLRAPLKMLESDCGNLKELVLLFVHGGQMADVSGDESSLVALRVKTTDAKGASAQETSATGTGLEVSPPDGVLFLCMGEYATYRVEATGEIELVSDVGKSAFMKAHGDLLSEVLAAQREVFAGIVENFAAYAELRWIERSQRAEIPRLEGLLRNIQRLGQIWEPVCVADEVFTFLLRRIDLFNLRDSATPPGILLHGYPGNGKEYLARRIADSVFAEFVRVDADEVASAQAVKQLWTEHRGGGPVVLYLDYADQLFPKAGSENAGAGTREGTLAWLEEWSRHEAARSGIWVVMSAQSEQGLHPRLLAHFGSSRVEVAAPDARGRSLILANACIDNQMDVDVPDWVVDRTAGTSIRELRDIVKETRLHCVPNPPQDEDWRAAIGHIRGSDAGFRDERKTWDRLVLPAEIKDQLLRVAKILKEADKWKGRNVRVPNVLLFGPPGTGKTDIARTFANEGGVKFMMASTADLKAEYIGQSAHRVREVFGKARAAAPCVLFIDEIESVTAKRGSAGADQFTQEIVTQMLQEMEGAQKSDRDVFVLAATNRPEDIDDAILNRFGSRIEVPLPDEAGRRELLVRLLREQPLDPQLDVDELAAQVAKRTNRKSGRDLVKLIERAMQRGVLSTENPEDMVLTRDLLMAELDPAGREVSDAELEQIWSRIVLKPAVKDDIMAKIRMFNKGGRAAPRGLLLYGPPGTGKTEIARRIADSASCFFMPLKASDLKAGYVGQSGQNVKAIWEKARSRGRCVIFVDECEGVFARRGGTNADSATEETVQAFLAEWDGVGTEDQRVWVLGATNRHDLLDSAIVSRFGAGVEIGLPEAPERLQILRLEMEKLEAPTEIPEFLGRATTGLSGRNLSTLARDVLTLAEQRNTVPSEELWREALSRQGKSGSDSVDASARWENLVLAPATLQSLKNACSSLKDAEVLIKQGYKPPAGALLFGPPGTGKTQIARTLANESGLAFIAASPADLKAGFVGQSGQKVRELFERAREKAPSILFLDEVESIASARGGSGGDSFTGEIVTQLLTELDGAKKSDRHVFLLAATNLPEQVDPAILSRFDQKIEIPLPDADQRRQLFEIALRKKATDFDAATVATELAGLAGKLGGRDIFKLVERASQRAIERARAAGTIESVVLSREDLLLEAAPQGSEMSAEDIGKVWEKIVLEPSVKEDILHKVRLFSRADKKAPKGLLLYGPPGTGKTEIARRIAESANCFFMSLKASDLKAGYVGQSGQNVKAVWEKARSRGRCVMFVDECEGVFARRGGTNADSATEETVQAFLAEWDGVGTEDQRVWVVGATNRRDLLDDAIVSRFGAAVEIGLPGAAERLQILALELAKLEMPASVPEFVGQATAGFSGRNLATLARDVGTLAEQRGGELGEDIWREVIARHSKSGSEAVDEGARWSSLILSEQTLERLRTTCEMLRHTEVLQAQGVDVPKAALLYGPPGTGKTQIARTLANESGLPFLAATTADVKAGYVGQSGQKVKELFERARGRAPCILFVDEIEAVTPVRGGPNADQFTNEIVNQFLQELDGIRASAQHVFLLGATNIPDAIDPAILSRFGERIEIPRPDEAQRLRLFRLFLGRQRADFDVDAAAATLARRHDGLSGREIGSIVKSASQLAVRRAIQAGRADQVVLTEADFGDALSGREAS